MVFNVEDRILVKIYINSKDMILKFVKKFSDKVGMLLSIADETERYRREGVVNPPVVM